MKEPFAESFDSNAHDVLFNTEEFATLLETQVVVEAGWPPVRCVGASRLLSGG